MPPAKPKLCLITLGCKANQYDSAAMLGYLGRRYEIVDPVPQTPADIYLLNTCTVTHKADADARQWILRARRMNPAARIIVTGCLAEISREKLRTEKIDALFGVSERSGLIEQLCASRPELNQDIFYHPAGGWQLRARAVLKVQEGCDYRCSYCVVPYARGRSRSLGTEIILEQMRALRGQGFEEVVLCGINLGEWGKTENRELADLIEAVENAGLGQRVRLSSLEPMSLSDRLLKVMADSRILCPHLHLPLQSGDNEILRQMKRPYSSEEFLELAQKLLSIIPGLGLGMDVMVGFPGEGQKEFNNTLRLLEAIPFAYLHIFSFSPRPNTPARRLRPKVPEGQSRERARILAALAENRRREFAISQIGRKMEIVVEGRHQGWAFGHSGNYLQLKVRTSRKIRERVPVRLAAVGEELIAEEREVGQGTLSRS